MATVNRNQYFSQQFMKASHMNGKPSIQVEIESFEEFANQFRNGVPQPGLRLKGYDLPLALNATNFDSIIKKLGDDTDKWIGKKITLRVEQVAELKDGRETGKKVPGLRIS